MSSNNPDSLYHSDLKTLMNFLEFRVKELEEQRNAAVHLLAEWVVDIDTNGTGWDDWDENYKEAGYRPGPLRELIDAEIKVVKQQKGN